ncbi:hypothetical protein [Nocardioides sp.]|uniref:hypothetical protein n=1 Tax=Nocardioides sp. TaxID=35761 RepID=UPI003528E7A5
MRVNGGCRGEGRRLVALASAALLLTLPACGDQEAEPGAGEAAPITARAVAAVMLDHLPQDTSSRQATYVDENSPRSLVGADFRYHSDGEDDGDLVAVRLYAPDKSETPSCEGRPRCVTEEVGSGTLLVAWDLVEPEEDPGLVSVSLVRDAEVVSALLAGPEITKDPRRQTDLEPSVDDLIGLVQDPRLRLEADAATVAAGEALRDWDGGERPEGSLDVVDHTGRTMTLGWVSTFEKRWHYLGRSPYVGEFGPGAVGGRARVGTGFLPLGPGVVDVIASPQAPAWADSCLPDFTCREVDGVLFAWRPASGEDPGESWMVHRRADEVVAVHVTGRPMPAKAQAALGGSGFFLLSSDLTDPTYAPNAPSLQTTRARFEAAQRLPDVSGHLPAG